MNLTRRKRGGRLSYRHGHRHLSRLWLVRRGTIIGHRARLTLGLGRLAQSGERLACTLRVLFPITLGVCASECEKNLWLTGHHLRSDLKFLNRSLALARFEHQAAQKVMGQR